MRAVNVLAALAVALAAPRAWAGELHLSWRAPDGCPSQKQVHDAAVRSAEASSGEALDADARVEHGDRWSVTIRTTRSGSAAAERRLEAASCGALADATAVILATALIPAGEAPALASADGPASAGAASGPASAAGPAAASASGPAAASAPASERDRAAAGADGPYAHALAASAALVTDSTTLPSPALGGRAGLAWTPGRARIELAGSYFADQSRTTPASSAGATFSLLTTGGRGCWAIVRGDIELSPCVGGDAQVISARGFGAAQNHDRGAAWFSVTGGALFRVPVASWLALRADADVNVPLSRPRFVVEGDGAVHKPAAFGVRAGIGAELLFL